ncbi:Parkin Interacting Substrate [Carabus blaptoides fortunei]
MKSINAESTVDSKVVCLSEIITFCVSLEVAENDGLPSQICIQCMEELCRYYKFKLQCQKSDETLRYYINLTESEIKNEDTLTDDLENVVIKHEVEVTSDDNAIKKSKKKLHVKQSTTNSVESECYDEDGWSDVSWSLDNSSDREKQIKITNSGPPFMCKRCDICFETSDELVEHKLTVKHPRKRTHLCTICSKAFTYSQLKVHMRSHTREKPFSCQEHVRTHTGETPFVCSYCGKSFTQSGQLRTHVKKHTSSNGDTNLRSHQCNICEKLFQTKSILKTHMLIHGEKSFLCSDCGRGFVSLAGLHSHSKTHTGVKPYPCSVCGKSFRYIDRTHADAYW